jgi:hypothetical protein
MEDMAMMRRLNRSSVLLLLGLLGLAGSAPAHSDHGDLRDDLTDYASWRELTHGPYKVSPAVSALCTPPQPQPSHPGDVDPGGRDHFIRVYANAAAAPLLRSRRGEKFPVGAVIAKVKLLEGRDVPASIAFMVKRKAGFHPASLDWEFLFFDGRVQRQMSAGTQCQGCHGNLKEADGVFGSYLSGT